MIDLEDSIPLVKMCLSRNELHSLKTKASKAEQVFQTLKETKWRKEENYNDSVKTGNIIHRYLEIMKRAEMYITWVSELLLR